MRHPLLIPDLRELIHDGEVAGLRDFFADYHPGRIAELIDDGQITVGVIEPVGCVAVASQDANTLAQLKRRKGETLLQLLTRLDQAIDKMIGERAVRAAV